MRKNVNALHAGDDDEAAARHRKRATTVDGEAFVKRLQEYLDQRVSQINAHNAADAGKNEQLIASLGERIHREVASLAEAGRSEAESRIKDLGERLERQLSANLKQQEKASEELAANLAQAIKQQAAKLGEIDRVVGALSQRFEALIANLAEAERGNSAIRTALIGSMESTVTGLAEKGRADSQLLLQNLESNRLQLAELILRESAKTAALIASFDEKIVALAEKNRTETEALARTFEGLLRELTQASRAQAERTSALVRSLEAKIAALAARTEAETMSLAQSLGQRIETESRRLMDSAQAEAAKTAAAIESLAQKFSTTAESGQAQVMTLANTLSQKLERYARDIVETARAEAAGTASRLEVLAKQVMSSGETSRLEAARATAALEEKLAALAERSKADSESLAQALGQQIEQQARILAEQANAQAAQTVALFDSLAQQVSAVANEARVHSESLVGGLAHEIAGHVLHLTDNARATNGKTLELLGALEDRVAAFAAQGRADSESLARTLREHIERSTQELADTTRAEAAATGARLETTIAALSAQVQADTESVASGLSCHLQISARQLAEGIKAESAKTVTLIGLLEARVAALAEASAAESAALGRSLVRQIDARAHELAETTREEAAKAAALFENRISALAEQNRIDSESLALTLGGKIETQGRVLAENMHAETAKASAFLAERIAAAAQESRAEAAALANILGDRLDSHIRALTQSTQTDTAKIVALMAAIQENVAAFAEKNRVALELQAKALAAELNAHLAELREASRAHEAELSKLLDTGIKGIEQGVAVSTETSRAQFQSQFKAFDDEFHRRLNELAQRDIAKTDALAEALRHKIDLGIAALLEGTRAESTALESVLRTLVDQLGRRLGAFTETFRSEFETGHKKIDALCTSVDRQIEQLSHLAAPGGLIAPLDGAELDGTETLVEAAPAQARPFRQRGADGEQPAPSIVGPSRILEPAQPLSSQDGESLALRETKALSVPAEVDGAALMLSTEAKAPLHGESNGKADAPQVDDPFDPIVAAPEAALVSDDGSFEQTPRPAHARRWFGFRRIKY